MEDRKLVQTDLELVSGGRQARKVKTEKEADKDIKKLVKDLKKKGKSRDDITIELTTSHRMSLEDARDYVEKYY